ncbi:MAG: hydroxyacid dehydrogenase [Acidobacteria bacterium]|nr:MAG: hydroxyacid dehydrogenase [Acidobacteriota bacterium]
MKRFKIQIDGVEYEVDGNKPLLQNMLDLGLKVPYFCYHPKLKIIGACRMCVVLNEKTGRLITSCNTYPEEGMSISLEHPTVKDNQRYLLQAFMTRHPLDCPICDKAGECDLQNYGAIFGPQKQIVPVSALEKERHQLDWESDFLEYYSNRCVVCYRCTRACDDINGAHALYVEERGFQANIAPTLRPMDTSVCEMCGLCVHVCPVGAIISKPFKYWTRSWLLRRGNTVCNLCPVGCEVQVEYGVGDWRSKEKVYRTKPTDDLNICARAFFGYDSLNYQRLKKTSMFGKEDTKGNIANYLSILLKGKKEETAVVLSSYLTNEDYMLIRGLIERTGITITVPSYWEIAPFLRAYGRYEPISIKDLKDADFYLLIGEDITSTAPVLSYYIRGRVYKIGKTARDVKLKPVHIEREEVKSLKGKGVFIINMLGMTEEEGRYWGEFLKSSEHRVMLVHTDVNFLGLMENIPLEWLSDMPAVFQGIEEGKIKNLILFGEDVLEYVPMPRMESLMEKLEHVVVFSPFEDGLSQYAHIKVPMGMMGEVEGSYTTLMGKVRARSFLPNAFNHTEFLRLVVENLPEERTAPKVLRGGSLPNRREVHLYRNNWITSRSENLTRLYEKNMAVEEVISWKSS